MASRVVFFPTGPSAQRLVDERLVEFTWVPGMAISQGTKSVINLHTAAKEQLGIASLLEISTRSPEHLGISLSAFNLQIRYASMPVSVEVAYQSSKVFQNGGPYLDLLKGSSMEAKQDRRLKTSGELLGFEFEEIRWPLTDSPNFYDYLYIRGLLHHSEKDLLPRYQAFTDIAFNQNATETSAKKSFNCQARTAAIYCSLIQRMSEQDILSHLVERSKIVDAKPTQLGLF